VLVIRVVHTGLLHVDGSRNPLGVMARLDKAESHWFYTSKDMVGFVVVGRVFVFIILLLPYVFMDAENFLFVDSLKTPEHIKPEWYSLFAYRILRRVPNKVGGVVGLVMRIVVLILIPYVKNNYYKIQLF
jgi:ubiquinol-cytochrome c reductase cytochrome b subunit